MAAAHVPGGAIAIVKDGRLMAVRSYGLANIATGEAFQPDTLCRIGSISKTVTAVTILNLVEGGKLGLDDKVFSSLLGNLQPPVGRTVDPRLRDISVRHLLHHTGGHGRASGVDPLNSALAETAAEVLHTGKPPGYETIIRYAMGLPLDFDPGMRYSYSNFGFMVLARVIEKVTGQPYENAVREQVLIPLSLRRMALGRTMPDDLRPGEAHYYDMPRAPLALSMFPDARRLMPRPYAQFELEAADGCGQWIASAIDLARLVARVEGSRVPALFGPDTLKLLFERPVPFVSEDPAGRWWYGLGTVAWPNGAATAWNHNGAYYGNIAGYESWGNGYVFAFVFNATPDNGNEFI